MNQHTATIVLSGGGTVGPVMPLLALQEYIHTEHPSLTFALIGTNNGPEERLAQKHHIPFYSIFAGKLRRYLSLKNLFIPFWLAVGFMQSLFLLKRLKPKVVVGAGGFVQVPVICAAKILGIPVLIHQQDIIPSLANKLVAPFVDSITTSFQKSIRDFNRGVSLQDLHNNNKVIWTGNPYKRSLKEGDKEFLRKKYKIPPHRKVITFMGGGTGANGINTLVWNSLSELVTQYDVIHLTGRRKLREISSPHYYQFEFYENMADLYAASDIIVCRAGLSTITELAALKKACIVIPMPHSHQEANGAWLEAAGAAIVLAEQQITAPLLLQSIHNLLNNEQFRDLLVKNLANTLPAGSTGRVAKLILQLTHHHART